jgi:hypothetical protein
MKAHTRSQSSSSIMLMRSVVHVTGNCAPSVCKPSFISGFCPMKMYTQSSLIILWSPLFQISAVTSFCRVSMASPAMYACHTYMVQFQLAHVMAVLLSKWRLKSLVLANIALQPLSIRHLIDTLNLKWIRLLEFERR